MFKYYLAEIETWVGEEKWCDEFRKTLPKQCLVAVPISTKRITRKQKNFEYEDMEQVGLKIEQETGHEPENWSMKRMEMI